MADNRVVQAEIHQKWTEYEGEQNIITPAEAIDRLKSGSLWGSRASTRGGERVAKEMGLIYYADLPGKQDYLQPVYRFKIEANGIEMVEINGTEMAMPYNVSYFEFVSALP